MARGESEAKGAPQAGLVIGAVFGVACLASLLAVVTAHRDTTPTPVARSTPAPFPGAYGLLTSLRWRDCVEGLPPAPLEVSLRARGYVAEGAPRPAPGTEVEGGLDDACGIVLIRGTSRPTPSCGQTAVAVAHCGPGPIALVGADGRRSVAAFALPGFSAGDAPSLPLDERLAHAEAAALLAGAGYEAGDLAVDLRVGGRGEVTLPLPPAPATGCVALVATLAGSFDDVVVEHGGGIRGRSRPAGHGDARQALVGLPHCAGPDGTGALRATNVSTEAGLRVVYRAFTPPTGPGARGATTPLRRVGGELGALVADTPAR